LILQGRQDNQTRRLGIRATTPRCSQPAKSYCIFDRSVSNHLRYGELAIYRIPGDEVVHRFQQRCLAEAHGPAMNCWRGKDLLSKALPGARNIGREEPLEGTG
jgi:hypothetical protein